MEVEFRINGVIKSLDVAANESLLAALRREGYYSVRHGCETGECGACAILIDGTPRPACVTFAAQVGGCTLTTVEGLGTSQALHPLQQAFIDAGAVGCGFCTPGMILSAYALLKQSPDAGEEAVRDALSGNLCRCTGYVRPVQAVLRAAAIMRGETVEAPDAGEGTKAPGTATGLREVGRARRSLDAGALVTGKAAFVDDIEMRGMLYARVLTSPHAHAVIRDIDVSEARALPGVHAVLTYRDIARVPYASKPGTDLRDQYNLDYVVRFVGDRVAAVAAETPEIAEQALRLIHVSYEALPAVLDPRRALEQGAPRIHPETESTGIYDAARNVAAHLQVETGNVERGFAEADLLVEGEYIVPQAQQAPIENHMAITYLDEGDRLIVRTSAASAHAVQHLVALLTGLPPRRIRVVAPRVGDSFGAKQGIQLEDICALLTLVTQRPVRLEYSRADEFSSGRTLPAFVVHLKTAVRRDGTIIANQVRALAGAGAYGSRAQEILRGAALNALPLYSCGSLSYVADAVYTNLPPAGAGAASLVGFALESHMDEIAKQLGMDALELRRRNWVKAGDENRLAQAMDEQGEGAAYTIESSGLPQCVQVVAEKLGWHEKRGSGATGRFRRGVGMALAMHGTPVPGDTSKSGASIRLDEDGSFTVLVGSATPGDGSDTILAQVAAEVLGVGIEDILVHTSDTDIAPFESGMDTSASSCAAAKAVMKAAQQVRARVIEVAGHMLGAGPGALTLEDGVITARNGDTLTVAQVAAHTLYAGHEPPIMADAAEVSGGMSPSFAAQGAEVEVDTETGVLRVLRALTAVDGGRVINPLVAESQADGSIVRALGLGVSEEMLYDQQGAPLTTSLSDYRIYSAPDAPQIETNFVEAPDPSGPFGSKAFASAMAGGMAPAVANAVADALGIRIRQLPLTPERVLLAIRTQAG